MTVNGCRLPLQEKFTRTGVLHRGIEAYHVDSRRTDRGSEVDDPSARMRVAGQCPVIFDDQLVAVMVVRQSLSRLWVPHSSFHSAAQARSPRRMNRPPPWMVLTWPKTGSMVRLRWT